MKKMKKSSVFVFLLLVVALSGCSSNKPSEEKIKASIKKIMPIEPKITSVKPLDYFPGLVEVVISIDGKPIVYYTDTKGDYVVSGSILRAEDKVNLTQEVMKTLVSQPVVVPTSPATTKK
ncbi:MAG: disulfide isomerase DsbC N-terminal domain-containing protein [Desulfuromonadaceae bacterium]|nr:disulfide isomerase DsbC N-terminal domain-containing protein [Desulfuromonadaceae bacterium]MDD2855595.1 disulfide isomerase DsbC N-terminal domain-containing protein [Desulfuromonadaceae bacterium]